MNCERKSVGQVDGGPPLRQDPLKSKGNSASDSRYPTKDPTSVKNSGLRSGELAWIAYTSMFGGQTGEWSDLSIADKARWSCVEAGILREARA